MLWNEAKEKNIKSGTTTLLDHYCDWRVSVVPLMTNNEFDNVFLVFTRLGKYMCTYINICINKLKRFLTRNCVLFI